MREGAVEGYPDSTDYSTVCNVEPEKDFKDFCLVGKDCLIADNSNIAYQQCYSRDGLYFRYYFDN